MSFYKKVKKCNLRDEDEKTERNNRIHFSFEDDSNCFSASKKKKKKKSKTEDKK